MGKRYVVCVDDEVIITESLKRELRNELPGLVVEAAYSGEKGFALLDRIHQGGDEVAVLVTDERMPGMKGHELLRESRVRYPGINGILLTGYSDIEAIAQAVNESGLFRYMHKPWERRDLAMAVTRAAELYDRERELESLRQQVKQLNTALIAALEGCNDGSNPESFCHVQRVAKYAALLGRKLGLPDADVRKLYLYAPLHDIGKAGIPHEILSKPGTLTAEEFQVVKKHVRIGTDLLKSVEIDPLALDLILYHHERWDGKGYLAEVSGERIPLAARITAVADVLDAMLSNRSYKDAIPFDTVAAEIIADAGTRFDPEIVTVFEANLDAFRQVSEGLTPACCADFKETL